MDTGESHSNVISSDILTPHYVIVEDPISVHSYADVSGVSLPSDLSASVQHVQSISTDTGQELNKSPTIYINTSHEIEKKLILPTVASDKVSKADTILSVPDLSDRKGSKDDGKDISEFNNSFVVSIDTMNEFKSGNNEAQDNLMSEENGDSGTRHIVCQTEDEGILSAVSTDTQSITDETDQDKTMFSENLGLIPAKSEEKILIAQRAKQAQVGVRTRKSLETSVFEKISQIISSPQPPKNKETTNLPASFGHKHKAGCYRCGSCHRTFQTICKLHDHFQDHCVGGSYHYDHLLKTAFPKYDTACSYSQTSDPFEDESLDSATEVKPNIKSVGRNFKFKRPNLKNRMAPVIKKASILGKRKRGRPKKEILSKPKFEKDTVGHDVENDVDASEEMSISLEIVNDDEIDDDAEDMFEKEYFLNEALDLMNKAENKGKSIEETTENEAKDNTEDLTEDSDVHQVALLDLENLSRSQKRKMTIPRKIMKTDMTTDEKIINSRTKPCNKIKCDFCSCEFQYTRGLIRHEQEKHADQMKYECDRCEQRFMREYNLERHKLCSHRITKSGYAHEIEEIHQIPSTSKVKKKGTVKKSPAKSPEEMSPCLICGNDVPNSKMDVHVRLHTGERPYICHVCGKGLISDKKLKRHLLIHSALPRHTCDVCGEGFAMKCKLRTHMFIHTGHKPYLCSVCGGEFNNSASLLHHNRTVHLGDKRYECTICGGRYGKKSQLEEHMFSHSDERTQTCRYCGKSFKHAKSLRRHESTHVSDTKFECDQCDSKFRRKDNLDRHKMCHIATTLQCSFCKKKFRERQPLLDHEQFHINQKKRQCQICKDKFRDENYFYNHMEKNHGITRDMVPVVNAIANSPEKESKPRKTSRNTSSLQNALIDRLKLDLEAEHLGLTDPKSSDTLNKCMSAAGILPTTSTNQVLGNMDQSTSQGDAQGQQNIINSMFAVGMPQVVSNTYVNQNLTSTVNIGNVISTGQRISLSSINVGENGTIQLSLDQPESTLTLGSESTILTDQQRLMLNVSAIHNLQDQGFRMPNMY